MPFMSLTPRFEILCIASPYMLCAAKRPYAQEPFFLLCLAIAAAIETTVAGAVAGTAAAVTAATAAAAHHDDEKQEHHIAIASAEHIVASFPFSLH